MATHLGSGVIVVPDAVKEQFLDMAIKMVDPADGKIVEYLTLVVGYQDQEGVHATHIIFPVQEGKPSKVSDQGRTCCTSTKFYIILMELFRVKSV
jgi:hypothetical protein